MGLFLSFSYFMHFLIPFAQNKGYELPKWGGFFLTTSDAIGTARTKRAGTRKVNELLKNARAMHGTVEALVKSGANMAGKSFLKSESDGVFQNYTLRGESSVEAGSLFWVWERIVSRELFDSEGIWFPSRLIIFQVGQIVVAAAVLFLLFFFVERVAKEADEATASLEEGLPDWIYDLVPTGAQVRFALIPALAVSVAVCVILILIYIPR
jgi:hypothetical protein